jgi:hypothetical protein
MNKLEEIKKLLISDVAANKTLGLALLKDTPTGEFTLDQQRDVYKEALDLITSSESSIKENEDIINGFLELDYLVY